jgi:hypothetical protein
MGDRPRYWPCAGVLLAIVLLRSDSAVLACTPAPIETIIHVDSASLPPDLRVMVEGKRAFLVNGSTETVHLADAGGRNIDVRAGTRATIPIVWQPSSAGAEPVSVVRLQMGTRILRVTLARAMMPDPHGCDEWVAQQTRQFLEQERARARYWVRPALTYAGAAAAAVAVALLCLRRLRG